MRTAHSLPYGGGGGAGDLCPRGVFVQGVSVQGVSGRAVSVQGVSVKGGLCQRGDLCPGGLCLGGSLCPGGSPREKPPSLCEQND